MRRLIINADDFGLTSGVNRAIIEAHTQGVVSSATLMANAPAGAEAVRFAAENPRLGTGCHVVLLDGMPVLAPQKIQSLARARPNGGELRESLGSFAARALTGRLQSSELEAEAVAQIRKIQGQGVMVTHVDTHKHAHVLPVVWRALLTAARWCGIRAVRNPFVRPHSLPFNEIARRPALWKRYLEVRLLRGAAANFRRAVRDVGMITTDGSFGIVETGWLDGSLFAAAVSCIPDGTWEFVCHPGHHDTELDSVKTRLRESRARELHVLTSPQARDALDRRGIQLISYRDLIT